MAVRFSFSLALLSCLWTSAASHQIPEGVFRMECRDRYFMIAINLSFTGDDPQFEATDEMGVYPITKTYGAQHGYSVNIFPGRGILELRASYFSSHTYNKKDEVFGFNFNLIVSHGGQWKAHPLNKTCTPALSWAPKEITCEVNYMEVSLKREVTCPSEMQQADRNGFRLNYPLITEDLHMVLHTYGAKLKPMSLSDAFRQGYIFHVTYERLVLRTAYGQVDSVATEINGVPVEVFRSTVYARKGLVMFMVDLVATCSMHEGTYESGYLKWETPEDVDPIILLDDAWFAFGIDGELLEKSLVEQRGYIVKMSNSILQIRIPYNAEGGWRKSLVSDGLKEFYIFNLYVEQILLDEDQIDARLGLFRTLVTPLLPRPLLCVNETLFEERTFLVYLGDIPEDVALVAVSLNGREFSLQEIMIDFTVTVVAHTNSTHSYTMKVPFDHPVVIQQFSKHDNAMKYTVTIQFTLHVLPEKEPIYHQTAVVALMDASPPEVDAFCSDSGIRFTLEHRPFNHLWQITIGSDLLSSELATRHGYIVTNDSQRLQLDVPLFTTGYKYNNVTLKGFSGTFEVLLRDPEASEVHRSITKTCPFSLSQYISCSTNGTMTAMVDLSPNVQNGVIPAGTHLLDRNCRPKDSDRTTVLFSFPLNSCGTTVKVGKEAVTYQNEIFLPSESHNGGNALEGSHDLQSVTIQCTYPLDGLHRFFWTYMFDSDTTGVGRIVYAKQPSHELQTSTTQPTTAKRKWSVFLQPSYRFPSGYVKMPNFPTVSQRRGL
ncbi:uncharacterized protein [Takifugu rubripes]|uniref:uncharacterized protein n=1 Tax=Takifugu rubripes TaxID=31033 RepID=UPI0011458EB1|nr:uncharacterized protein LOC105416844 [Takifugu rubripes]